MAVNILIANMAELGIKELKFCRYYAATGNATESYLYCSNGTTTRESAATLASELLRKVEVSDKIKELKDIEKCQQQFLMYKAQEQSLKTVSLLLEAANKLAVSINKKLPDLTDPNLEEKIKKIRPSELKTIASTMSDCCSIFKEIRTIQLEFSGLTYIVENSYNLIKQEVKN